VKPDGSREVDMDVNVLIRRVLRRWPWHRCECSCNRNWGGPCGPCRCGR
jgi:hypothetical protein